MLQRCVQPQVLMRKNFLLLFFLVPAVLSFGQTKPLSNQQVGSLTLLGQLWGFLKYFHPYVAKGNLDWDSVLAVKVPLYLNASNKKDVSRITEDWIKELPSVELCKNCYSFVPDSLKYNLDLDWISKQNFSRIVFERLDFIRANRNIGANYYVEYDKIGSRLVNFIHEKRYDDRKFLFPNESYRLLLLYRYWNIVNFFSPYKHLNGKDWKSVLQENIQSFYMARDTLTYQLQYVKLINSLNDGHSTVHGKVMQKLLGNYYPIPFLCMTIDGQLVISSILNDSAAAAIHLKKGDILTEVNNENVIKRLNRLYPYVNASNEESRAMAFAESFLFRGPDSTFIIKKIRAGNLITDTIQLSQKVIGETITKSSWRVNDSIGYVDMGSLKETEVENMMIQLMHTRAIIFDIRNYPNNTWNLIASYLCKSPFIMCKVSYPDLDYPGVFKYAKPRTYGKLNNSPYAGKIILLADESSVSHAEFSIMGLQAATENSLTIGNATAGKDGDVTYPFPLPGGLFTRFSGLGIYYPDGTPTQRRGVKIDIKVRPTIKGLQEGRDEVLEYAIRYVSHNNKGSTQP